MRKMVKKRVVFDGYLILGYEQTSSREQLKPLINQDAGNNIIVGQPRPGVFGAGATLKKEVQRSLCGGGLMK